MNISAGKMMGYNWEWALDPEAPPRLRARTLIMGKEWLRKNAPKTFANWCAAKMHKQPTWSVDGEEIRNLPIEWGPDAVR